MFKRGFEFAPGYRLDSFLGKGQFGQVWKSSAPGGTYQAVKFIDLAGGQWEKEYEGIQRVKQIGHPNLMPILAIWLLGNDGKALAESVEENKPQQVPADVTQDLLETAQFVAEAQEVDWMAKHSGRLEARWMAVSMRLGGKNLLQRLAECQEQGHTGIPPKELLRLIEESAKGLDYLNFSPDLNSGTDSLQHCDVKPANIVLVGDSAVVCDFGLARIMAQDQATMSSVAGTPAFLPPEAINGKTSRNSDQYSLAVTYYQLRTGKLPLTGRSTGEIIIEHLHGKLTFDDVPDEERAVLRRATHFKPEERFESNSAMVEALREAFRGTAQTISIPPVAEPSGYKPFVAILVAVGVVLGAILVWRFALPPHQDLIAVNQSPGGGTVQGDPSLPVAPVEPLAPSVWSQLLNDSLADPTASVESFKTLVGRYPGLLSPQPIDLSGHDKDIQQATWITAKGAVGPGEYATLITRALQPFLIAFDMRSIETLILENYTNRLSAAPIGISAIDFSLGATRITGGTKVATVEPPRRPLFDHRPYASALAISPDQRWGASGGFDGQVLIWATDRNESQARATFSIGDADVTAILWHPTKDYLLVAGSDASIHLVECVPNWPERASPLIKTFSVSRELIDCAFDRWGEVLVATDAEGQLLTIAWKEWERVLLSGDQPKVTKLSTPGSYVRDFLLVDSDATGSVVVASGDASDISYYSLAPQELVDRKNVIADGPVISFDAAMLSDGIVVVSAGENGQMTVKRGGAGNAIIMPGHLDTITAVALSPDGAWLASVSWDGWATIRPLENNASGSFYGFRTESSDALTLVSWDPSGRLLITGGDNGRLTLWDARHLRLLALASPQTALPEPSPKATTPQPIDASLEQSLNL